MELDDPIVEDEPMSGRKLAEGQVSKRRFRLLLWDPQTSVVAEPGLILRLRYPEKQAQIGVLQKELDNSFILPMLLMIGGGITACGSLAERKRTPPPMLRPPSANAYPQAQNAAPQNSGCLPEPVSAGFNALYLQSFAPYLSRAARRQCEPDESGFSHIRVA
ncbi:hypothetical protein C8F04DRAFT_1236433 [Mycena alexandri]|uniref:Uncharacterized protein n=1 Tax=Mycena alexandri TaxID=1745969 RepID=A0AAD6SME4_9AGAR|nr:hypothetical protein C8F04DRAFT_1236433 [Mycena alexandri]